MNKNNQTIEYGLVEKYCKTKKLKKIKTVQKNYLKNKKISKFICCT